MAPKLKELSARVSELAAPQDGGEQIGQSALAKAQRIAQEGLSALGWSAQGLRGRRKSNPQKVRIAARLRRQATMSLGRVTDRLRMGTATYVAGLLQREQRQEASSERSLF